MVIYCAICTDDSDGTIHENGNCFCTKECNSRYSELSWVTKTLVYKYNEVFEKLGIWIAFDIWNKHYTDQESKIDCWGRKL